MKKLWKHDMIVTKYNIPEWPDRCVCEICLKSKQTRQPFTDTVQKRSSRPLHLVHSDVCGPFNPRTWNGKRYFVSFMDDYSHFTMIFLMEHKSEVLEKFELYYEQVTTFFNMKICRLRCDNGGEYTSSMFQKYCRTKGIQMETTMPYSPQQNGVAERLNRTLLDRGRALLQDSGLPKTMWGEAVLIATYIMNRSPSSAINERKTPFEMWHGTKPQIDKMRVFGSTAYTLIPKEKRGKLDSRSEKNIMVGYVTNGYKIWNPRKRTMFMSRDVVFDEKKHNKEPVTVSVESEEDEPENMRDGVSELSEYLSAEPGEQKSDPEDETEDEGHGDNNDALPSQLCSGDDSMEASTRRSGRERTFPGKYKDFGTVFGKTTGCALLIDSAEEVHSSEVACSWNAETYVDDLPTTIAELRKRTDWNHWKAAIESEIESLKKNDTWKLVPKPEGKHLVDCKWVFKVKRDEIGNVNRYKARLVAKGFSQRKGFDFDETYAPVARITTVRTLLAVANKRGYFIHQMDVRTAFLNGVLKEEIYMKQPEGLDSDKPGLVCKLNKALYGLKQAPRSWNEQFDSFIKSIGFSRSKVDTCMYQMNVKGSVVYLLLYVDDIILASDQMYLIEKLKQQLSKRFEMTDMGELKIFLGLKVDRDKSKGTLKISQSKYISNLLERFGMNDCNPIATPLEPNLKLEARKPEEELTKKPYRELIGCLTYLALASRPDISVAVNFFSRFQSAPTDTHWCHLKRILRYLKGTINLGLMYNRHGEEEPLLGYADADWGSDIQDRRSISGNIFQVFGACVSWMTRKQATISLSSTEAEYISLSQAACEAIWLKNLLEELGVVFKHPITLFEDNQSCIHIAEEPRDQKRMKHLDIRYHFIREKIQEGIFKVYYKPTTDQIADIFTKGLQRVNFQKLRTMLGMFG